jgi:hypothetical protein
MKKIKSDEQVIILSEGNLAFLKVLRQQSPLKIEER